MSMIFEISLYYPVFGIFFEIPLRQPPYLSNSPNVNSNLEAFQCDLNGLSALGLHLQVLWGHWPWRSYGGADSI